MTTISIRVPDEVLTLVDADALRLGLSRTAMLLRPWQSGVETVRTVLAPNNSAVQIPGLVPASSLLPDADNEGLGYHGPKARDRDAAKFKGVSAAPDEPVAPPPGSRLKGAARK